MNTTLNKILKHGPCGQEKGSMVGWDKLLTYLGKSEPDDEPLSIKTILESNGIDDALWALRAVDGFEKEKRLMACDFAESVLSIYEKEYPNDDRPRNAIQAARDYANGLISEDDLDAAAAASDASAAAWAASDASDAWAARAAAMAAWEEEQKKQTEILLKYIP